MIQDVLTNLFARAAAAAAPELGLDPAEIPPPELSRPRVREHGDWATNLALIVAPRAGRQPRSVADSIVAHLEPNELVAKVEVAGPGFINVFLAVGWLHDAVREILRLGPRFGRAAPRDQRVQVEFVSANPTGPLHVGHARNAALGDALSNVLEAGGYGVEREYYYNDAGRQMDLFAASVEARYLEMVGRPGRFPEEGYRGEYIGDIARDILQEHGDALALLTDRERSARIRHEAVRLMFRRIEDTLERFRVRFDTWLSERTLHESGAVRDAVQRLLQTGHAYEAEGATWFRATSFGDEKDRVLIRSNGEPTYFAADCAYLLQKFGRSFDHLVYVWGADHHGTVRRLLGAAEALGFDPSAVEVVLYQFVSFTRAGEPVRMSKRAGELVTLDELLDEVGPDAARYTLLTRSNDSALEFDLEAVTRQSMENPVYYVQYAHARVASLLRVAEEQGVGLLPVEEVPVEELSSDPELDLARKLAELPEVVALAADTRSPHRLTRYAEETASAFHHFYTECRVITDNSALTQARLSLSVAAKQVVSTVLGLLGVQAPESMERTDGHGS